MIKEAEAERKKQNAAGSGAAAGTMMPEPAEDTDRIGNLLCHERLKKGLELEDISQVLCIRRVYLEAIESGNYVELPPLPYSAGFVNSYAKYLGLNNTRITQLFREELNDGAREKRIFMTEDLSAEAGLPDKRYIIGGIAALFLIGGLWSLWHRSGDENAPTERIGGGCRGGRNRIFFSVDGRGGSRTVGRGAGNDCAAGGTGSRGGR